MGISAHDVTTTFRSSSTAATAATCRTGGRLKTYKTHRESGITHGAEMSYLNSTVMTFVSLPTRGIVRGRVEIIEHKARDVKSGETVIDHGTRFTIEGVKCGCRFLTTRIGNA